MHQHFGIVRLLEVHKTQYGCVCVGGNEWSFHLENTIHSFLQFPFFLDVLVYSSLYKNAPVTSGKYLHSNQVISGLLKGGKRSRLPPLFWRFPEYIKHFLTLKRDFKKL